MDFFVDLQQIYQRATLVNPQDPEQLQDIANQLNRCANWWAGAAMAAHKERDNRRQQSRNQLELNAINASVEQFKRDPSKTFGALFGLVDTTPQLSSGKPDSD